MGDKTQIEWTDATWNPVTGCSVVSPGCTHCYAMRLAGNRMRHHPSRAGLTIDTKAGPVWNGEVRFNREWLTQPLGWAKPRMIFVCAHGDLFHESVPDEWIDQVFAVMALTPQHTYQVLTKRSARMRAYMLEPERKRLIALQAMPVSCRLAQAGGHKARIKLDHFTACFAGSGPFRNVWLGVSAEDQKRADERIPDLLATPAAVRFISAEPLLGPIDLTSINHCGVAGGHSALHDRGLGKLDWVIAGGESGLSARPMHPDWPRLLRDQCAAAADVAFFFKQWGEWIGVPDLRRLPDGSGPGFGAYDHREYDRDHEAVRIGKNAAGRVLDGRTHDEMPRVAA